MLMRMSRKRVKEDAGAVSTGKCSVTSVLTTSEQARAECTTQGQALRHKHDQDEALESTSRVVGRLKRLGDVEMLLEEQTQRKALEKKAAELSAANEQHLSAMREAQSSLTASKAELADERKKANRQRIEILNLEQQIRTLRAAPPLWQIVQKHQHNK